MKVLLKEEVCRSHEQYTRPTEKAFRLLKRDSPKKKKKKATQLVSEGLTPFMSARSIASGLCKFFSLRPSGL